MDGIPAEAQVGFRHAAGLFRVVLEVGLDIEVRVVPDYFDGVLVRPNRAVGTQPPELAVDRPGVPRRFLPCIACFFSFFIGIARPTKYNTFNRT